MMVIGRKTHLWGGEWESLSVFKGGVFDNRYGGTLYLVVAIDEWQDD